MKLFSKPEVLILKEDHLAKDYLETKNRPIYIVKETEKDEK